MSFRWFALVAGVVFFALLPVRVDAVGTITGKVTDVGGAPLQGINVRALNPTNAVQAGNGNTDATGTYTFTVNAGTYLVRTATTQSTPQPPAVATFGYVNVAFPDIPCIDNTYCPNYVGGAVVVADGATITLPDFKLPRAGGISGRVTNFAGGAVAGTVQIGALREDGRLTIVTTSTSPGDEGRYQITTLPPGRYRVIADSAPGITPTLGSMVYANKPCAVEPVIFQTGIPEGDCAFIAADFVTVAAGVTTPNIDFTLAAPNSLSGTVRDESNQPIENAQAILVSADGFTLTEATTDENGFFFFADIRLTPLWLVVKAEGYLDRVLPGEVAVSGCPSDCDLRSISPTATPDPGANTGADAVLARGASISGRVTRATDGSPMDGIFVQAGTRGGVTSTTFADANGDYTISGLPDGQVAVWTGGFFNTVYTAYGNVTCRGLFNFDCDLLGTPVVASAATPLTGVDIVAGPSGSVSGVIRDAETGLPVANGRARIEMWPVENPDATAGPYVQGQNSPAGYLLEGVPPGAYYVTFYGSGRLPLIDIGYLAPNVGIPCPRGGCNLRDLTKVYVTAGATTTGIDGTLPRGAFIKGRVTDLDTGRTPPTLRIDLAGGISNPPGVTFNTTLGRAATFGSLDPAGNYWTGTGLAPGIYYGATFSQRQGNIGLSNGYVDVNWPNLTCPYGACGATAGNPIPVGSADVTGIDFVVRKGGTLGGTVRRSGDNATLAGVRVDVWNAQGKRVGQRVTNAFGGYTVDALPTGTYYVTTSNDIGYLDKAYNGVPCEPFCNPVTTAPVSVTQPAATTGIDFVLDRASSISGTVRNGGAPVAGVKVELYGALGNPLGVTSTRSDGTYAFQGLSFNVYFVRTRNSLGLIDGLFSALPCVGDACRVRGGTPIDLSAGNNATNVDLALAQPGTISGLVSNQANGSPLVSVQLQLIDESGAVAFATKTGTDGNYSFPGLAAGNYYVVTRNTPGFVDERADGQACSDSCNGVGGPPVVVTAGSTTLAGFVLSTGGAISGTVRTSPAPGVAIDAKVEVYDANGVPVDRIATANGLYQLRGLADGTYYVRTSNTLGFIDRLYTTFACSGYCDVRNGTPVTITGGNSSPLSVDFNLAPGGAINGTVRSSVSPFPPLAGVVVQAYDLNGIPAGSATSAGDGTYQIRGLRFGDYRLQTFATGGLIDQVYNGQSCSPQQCRLSTGTRVNVGGSVGPFNFNLAPGASISGTAFDRFRNPLPTGTATLYGADGSILKTTDVVDGRWEFTALAAGTYYVLIGNNVGLVDQLYSGVPCAEGSCNITALGSPIVVGAAFRAPESLPPGSNLAAIDFQLADGVLVSGRVTGEMGVALAGEQVYVFDNMGRLAGEGTTDAQGNYTIGGGLPNGTYYAATSNGTEGVGGGYINELFGGNQCPLACNVLTGTSFTAPASNVDFSLGVGVGFSGTVVDDLGFPVPLVTITVVDSDGQVVGTFDTDSLGNYAASGLPGATYYARTSNNLGLIDQLFGGTSCIGNCNVLTSAPISTSVGNEPGDVDFVVKADQAFRDGFETP